ncbi:leucyl aminopeptidase [Ferrovibrio sp.]|uniref:leucyl aminopeptidase n=1 Tax=Ferrovibrio sp. TaxID=1917215 RepID=UPI001B42137F|nr:leucyl aminopeptidase [Ferrovibrio sp.]MBP7064596.1 leucyl aminopeptidase [Ferrovibrio sp.]
MKIDFAALARPKQGALVVLAADEAKLSPFGTALDKALGGALARALAGAPRFKGSAGQWLELVGPGGGFSRVLIAGLGKAADIKAEALEAVAGEAVKRITATGETALFIAADLPTGAKAEAAEAAARAALGARLGGYRFDKYRTTRKEHEKPSLKTVTVLSEALAAAKKAYQPLAALADGVTLTRDLVSEPANVIYPETLAAECRKLAKLGVKVEVLGEKQMQKLGMGALLGVGQGSVRESQLVVMQWQGGKKADKPVAFVGKGVCFDTGGISIKPSAGMEEMKWDMGGAGAVIGAMAALAGRKAKANVIGVVALVENMPDGNAQRPGDIVTSMSGQTIEVLNTDAEGRLILCDALWYCQQRFKPQFMVDLATLTGAIIIALGHEHAGLFANDDKLSEQLTKAGKAEGEPLWRLPLSDNYDKAINSPIADMQNIAGPGAGAGSITAAQFLQRFVNKTPWAHLDIAGTAWSKADKPTVPKGATAFGVRLLNRLVQDNYEG